MKGIVFAFFALCAPLCAERMSTDEERPELQPCYLPERGVYTVLHLTPDGIIELNNEYQFEVVDGSNVYRRWNLKDRIAITPNNSFLYSGEYAAVNLTKNQTAMVKILRGAHLEDPRADLLAKIDEAREEIVLSNSKKIETRWKINHDDFRDLLKYWKIGTSVMVGKNDTSWISSLFSSDPHILICFYATERNLYVRATQIPL